jgi:predicted dehydrogenase
VVEPSFEATTAGRKQAEWRTDPALNGPGGCIGDIGVHAFHLLEYVTGLEGNQPARDAAFGGGGTAGGR